MKTGDKIKVNYYGFDEEVTVGDVGNKYADIIFSNGDTKKIEIENK